MKKKLFLFITLFFTTILTAKAEQLINYDWSFDSINNNYGYGLNNVFIVNDKYFTWHLDSGTFSNVITEYDTNGQVIKKYEPLINYPIIDLIYFNNTYIAIDRLGTIYKLDNNFNIIKSISNQESIPIINDKSELKISNNTIYYIDKTNYHIFSSDYNLDNYKYYNLNNINNIDELFKEVSFLSKTDKIYFKYLYSTLDNSSKQTITDILKKDNNYYITSMTYKEDNLSSSLKLVNENFNNIWQVEYSNEIPVKILTYEDYLFILSINPTNKVYNLKVYNKDYKFIKEESINISDSNAIPISLILNNQNLIIKSVIYTGEELLTLNMNEKLPKIILNKYNINIFNIRTIIKGEGAIDIKDNAISGEEVSYEVVVKDGYKLDKLLISDINGNNISSNNNTFIMPNSNVTITAFFTPKNPNTEDNINYLISLLVISITILILSLHKYKRCN